MKHAWRNLEWEAILSYLHIDLSVLYDQAINYWSESQVREMHRLIKLLNADPEAKLKCNCPEQDINELMKFFEFYVDNQCVIYVI